MVSHAREHELLQGYTPPPRTKPIKVDKVNQKKQKEKKFRGGGGGGHMHENEHDQIANYANDGNCFKCGQIGHFSSECPHSEKIKEAIAKIVQASPAKQASVPEKKGKGGKGMGKGKGGKGKGVKDAKSFAAHADNGDYDQVGDQLVKNTPKREKKPYKDQDQGYTYVDKKSDTKPATIFKPPKHVDLHTVDVKYAMEEIAMEEKFKSRIKNGKQQYSEAEVDMLMEQWRELQFSGDVSSEEF